MSKGINKAISSAIADFWVKCVVKPKFDCDCEIPAIQLTQEIAGKMVKPISSRSKELFRKAIYDYCIGELSTSGLVSLCCDYQPDKVLTDIASKAGIPLSNLPWKVSSGAFSDYAFAGDEILFITKSRLQNEIIEAQKEHKSCVARYKELSNFLSEKPARTVEGGAFLDSNSLEEEYFSLSVRITKLQARMSRFLDCYNNRKYYE